MTMQRMGDALLPGDESGRRCVSSSNNRFQRHLLRPVDHGSSWHSRGGHKNIARRPPRLDGGGRGLLLGFCA
jgi:hypothetical protein